MGVRMIETLPVVDALAEAIASTDEFTQNRVAKRLGVSSATMSHWLRGVVQPTPTPQMVNDLAELLQKSPTEVLTLFGFTVSDEVPTADSVNGATGPQFASGDDPAYNVRHLADGTSGRGKLLTLPGSTWSQADDDAA